MTARMTGTAVLLALLMYGLANPATAGVWHGSTSEDQPASVAVEYGDGDRSIRRVSFNFIGYCPYGESDGAEYLLWWSRVHRREQQVANGRFRIRVERDFGRFRAHGRLREGVMRGEFSVEWIGAQDWCYDDGVSFRVRA